MNFKAVLFDLDGTLLNSIEDLTDSMNQVLSRFGFSGHDQEAYKYFVGDGVETLIRQALPADRVDEKMVAQCVVAMREEYGRRWDKKTRPYPGIPDLLDALCQRGFPMTILSNKIQDFTELCVSRLLSKWSFQIILGVRATVPKKPDPTAALEIAEAMGLYPGPIFISRGYQHGYADSRGGRHVSLGGLVGLSHRPGTCGPWGQGPA